MNRSAAEHRQDDTATYRQGDVLVARIARSAVPVGAVGVPADRRGRLVLARGEATGHAHVATGPGLRLLADPGDPELLYLVVPQFGRLVHEEHGPISLPAGEYRVIRQREYVPGSFRPVAD